MNELLLLVSVLFYFGGVVLMYYFFGKTGMYVFTVFATIAANIEVMILVNAFGMEMTLGNVLFAATFLCTDVLSEMEGKKAANLAVVVGLVTSALFLATSQIWLLYTPAGSDWALPAMREIFSNTPRLMISSFVVYAICQFLDVQLYHWLWKLTGGGKKRLWLRNNVATLISQLVNTFLFTVFAFWGVYDSATIVSIVIASYVIFIFTSLLDTPAVYLARKIGTRVKA